MARGKLILICQFGGDIVKSEDGSLSYTGGDAHAMYIFNDTLFSDLKLKLAEICNMEHKSMTIKYFLPGNKQVLNNLSNDKDLKKMLAFHYNSATADVFVFGKEGFDRDALKSDLCRATRIKLAETVDHGPLAAMVVGAKTSSAAIDDDEKPSYIGDDAEHAGNFCLSPATGTVKRKRCNEAEEVDVEAHDITLSSRSSKLTKRKKSRNGSPTMAIEERQEILIGEQNENDVEKLTAWKEGIDGPGQEFNNANEFRDALQKYAIAHRFMYRFKRNDDNRVNGRCAAGGCSWKIHAGWVPQTKSFRIKKMNKIHTCGGESWKNTYYAKSWLVNIIMKRLQSAPYNKLKDVAKDVARDFGIELKYAQVWRWVKDAKTQLKEEAYNQLLLFCEMMVKTNTDSVVIPSKSDDNSFQRLFLSFRSTIHGFREGCRPLLFLDSTSLRSKHKESLFVASAVDGNENFFPVAIAVVDVENSDSWLWFLEQLMAEVSISATITFISDQEKCLHELVPRVFENVEQGYSMYHLIESFKKNLKGTLYGDGSDSLLDSLMAAALANNATVFTHSMEHIKNVSPSTHDWLCKINPEYWANSLFKGERYNHITENSVQTFVELLEGAREQPIRLKVEAIVQMMGNLMNTRRAEPREWNLKLTPSKEKWLETEILKAANLQVLFFSESIFEVHDETVNIVNLETRECSCRGWGTTSMPCVHAIAVSKYTGRNVYDFCSKYFTVESFKLTYSKSINLVSGKPDNEGENAEDAGIVPPPVTSRPPTQVKMKPDNKWENAEDAGIVLPPITSQPPTQEELKHDNEGENAEDAGIVLPWATSQPLTQEKMKPDNDGENAEDAGIVLPPVASRPPIQEKMKPVNDGENAEDAGIVLPSITSRPPTQEKMKPVNDGENAEDVGIVLPSITSRPPTQEKMKPDNDGENAEDAGIVPPPITSQPPIQEKMKRGRRKGPGKRVHRCAKCKKTGHNKATCEADD